MLSRPTSIPDWRIQAVTMSCARRMASEANGLVSRWGSSLIEPSTSHRCITTEAARSMKSDGFENDVLRAFPQDELSKRRQLVGAVLDGREMVAGELSHPASENRSAVGKQDLSLADAAGIEQQLPGGGVARVIFVAEAQLEVAERDPGGLAAPAGLDQAGFHRQHGGELGAGLGCALSLEARLEPQAGHGDPHPVHAAILTFLAARAARGRGGGVRPVERRQGD